MLYMCLLVSYLLPFLSLRSWRYYVGARLEFWRWSRVPKKGSRDEAVGISRGFAARDGPARQISLDYITTAPPLSLSRLLHNTASYAGYAFLFCCYCFCRLAILRPVIQCCMLPFLLMSGVHVLVGCQQ